MAFSWSPEAAKYWSGQEIIIKNRNPSATEWKPDFTVAHKNASKKRCNFIPSAAKTHFRPPIFTADTIFTTNNEGHKINGIWRSSRKKCTLIAFFLSKKRSRSLNTSNSDENLGEVVFVPQKRSNGPIKANRRSHLNTRVLRNGNFCPKLSFWHNFYEDLVRSRKQRYIWDFAKPAGITSDDPDFSCFLYKETLPPRGRAGWGWVGWLGLVGGVWVGWLGWLARVG